MINIKVCGLKYAENIREVADLNPDYLGFIFYKNSPRYAFHDLNAVGLSKLPKNIEKVGVFVNENFLNIRKICADFQIKTIQLHGTETSIFCKKLKDSGFKIIKAFGINETFDFNKLIHYSNCVDFFLFDTETKNHGGSGRHFNWNLLKNYHLNLPYFLSGGISLDDLDEIKKINDNKFFAIDVNSRFEKEAGVKNIQMVKILINRIRDEF